jgi:hypothetical protein
VLATERRLKNNFPGIAPDKSSIDTCFCRPPLCSHGVTDDESRSVKPGSTGACSPPPPHGLPSPIQQSSDATAASSPSNQTSY